MLTKGDEYPIHQTPEPVAFSGTDRNFYDRFFFNGYAPDGSGFFGAALGIYPHLDVVDAHFNVIRNGVQHCVHASAQLHSERMDMRCGPLSISVEEPLESIALSLRDESGMAAELRFTGRHFPIEEPRFTHRLGPRAFMDYTRMTQNGRWSGWIEVDGDRQDLHSDTMGTRDRSWGVRPIGARDAQVVPGHELPAFFWQWTPVNFEDGSLFFHVNNDMHGEAWNTRAVWAGEGAGRTELDEGEGSMRTRLFPRTRWPSGGSLSIAAKGAPEHVEFEPLGRFMMKGLGYTHPTWGHGIWHGGDKVEREDIALDECDPLAPENLHVQMPVAVRAEGRTGIGVFEQLVIGPFKPLNLNGLLDGAA